MDKSIKDKLLSCRSYEDAKPILETVSLGQSAHELARTAFSIQAKQPTVANQFLKTVIQEMEDEEEEKNKKISEVDGGQSEQSSSTTGLEKIGSEEEAAESFHGQTDKKDQMGVAINESQGGMFPPQMPPVPQQQMGGGNCGGQMQPPQMTPQQQMQYTINETVKAALRPMQEAIKQLDKKIQETTKEQPRSLDLGSQMGKGEKSFAVIKETTGNPKQDLESARQEIIKMNNYLNSGRY